MDDEEIRFLNLDVHDWMTEGALINSDRPFETNTNAVNNAATTLRSDASRKFVSADRGDGGDDGFSDSGDGNAAAAGDGADGRFAEADSSPAKRTRSHVASRRPYDVLNLQAPVSRYVLAPHELDATQAAQYQQQLNAHQQLLAQGIEAALEAKQNDLVMLYNRMGNQLKVSQFCMAAIRLWKLTFTPFCFL